MFAHRMEVYSCSIYTIYKYTIIHVITPDTVGVSGLSRWQELILVSVISIKLLVY